MAIPPSVNSPMKYTVTSATFARLDVVATMATVRTTGQANTQESVRNLSGRISIPAETSRAAAITTP